MERHLRELEDVRGIYLAEQEAKKGAERLEEGRRRKSRSRAASHAALERRVGHPVSRSHLHARARASDSKNTRGRTWNHAPRSNHNSSAHVPERLRTLNRNEGRAPRVEKWTSKSSGVPFMGSRAANRADGIGAGMWTRGQGVPEPLNGGGRAGKKR